MSINKVMLMGRLGKDPESKNINSSYLVTASLATTKRWKDKEGNQQEQTQWHSIKAWNNTGKILKEYCKQGSLIYIEGEIEYSQSEKDGVTKYYTNITANKILLLDKKEQSDNNQEYQQPEQPGLL